ncbi:suppressor of tumorigenicity 14 protein homolog isoform X2 [Nematostella vectensis]|uniref:suppressor of tumorigenicity 14 protein homolog isoform X2 n=1 Tax=Nematostella vectensis TaxID=45351 RepID=UPI0020771EB8|nr:suppressor of tumorigenicity 14 protein homolog isoform X2 [Nematostella vectensis]
MSPHIFFLASLLLLTATFTESRRLRHRQHSYMAADEEAPSESVGNTTGCDKRPVLMTKAHGTLRSPGYPRVYSNNQRCTWHISVPRGYRIRIRFRRQYDIEESSQCNKDYVMMSQSRHFRDPLIFCGRRRPNGILTPKNNVWVRFKSDEGGNGKGFLALYSAVDDNECERPVCSFPRLCRNTLGSYACDCPEGYENRGRRDSDKCVDIDECGSGAARCDHKCVNTEGSYHCRCRKGYTLAPDGHECQDLNECNNKNKCSHFCRNTRSSYRCWCPKGFRLHSDKRTCYPEISFFSKQHSAEVRENSRRGAYVTTVRAVSFSKPRKIRYELIAENLLPPTHFTIEETTGTITVAGDLDREEKDSYLLEVGAGLQYPNGTLSRVARTYVMVKISDENDNYPIFGLPSYHVRVPCNTTAGRTVYRVTAMDRDLGDNARIRYRLQPKNMYFTILPHTGKIRVTQDLHRFCNMRPARGFTLSVLARDYGKLPETAHAWMYIEVTPPGTLSRDVSQMSARFLDPRHSGGTDTISRRKMREADAHRYSGKRKG